MNILDSKTRKAITRRYLRDIKNILFYQRLAPKTNQLIYINPFSIKTAIEKKPADGRSPFKRKHSAMIVSGDWDKKVYPIHKHSKIKACDLHFKDGLSWKKSGAYKIMRKLIKKKGSFDNCTSKKDIKKRYKRIDKLYEKIKGDQRIKPRLEIIPENHREYGGILVHIDRDGQPIFSGSGCHRLSIARALNLEKIPCELGVVHSEALKSDNYKKLIQQSRTY
jgi:hypothetical protein